MESLIVLIYNAMRCTPLLACQEDVDRSETCTIHSKEMSYWHQIASVLNRTRPNSLEPNSIRYQQILLIPRARKRYRVTRRVPSLSLFPRLSLVAINTKNNRTRR